MTDLRPHTRTQNKLVNKVPELSCACVRVCMCRNVCTDWKETNELKERAQ